MVAINLDTLTMVNFEGSIPTSKILQIFEIESSINLLFACGLYFMSFDNVSNKISYQNENVLL